MGLLQMYVLDCLIPVRTSKKYVSELRTRKNVSEASITPSYKNVSDDVVISNNDDPITLR